MGVYLFIGVICRPLMRTLTPIGSGLGRDFLMNIRIASFRAYDPDRGTYSPYSEVFVITNENTLKHCVT